MEKLLEKIPPEKRWAITAKALWKFWVLRGDKIIAPSLSREEGIIAPVLGKEKWIEINENFMREGGRQLCLMVQKMFNIPVENAKGAVKLYMVAGILFTGPEYPAEIVESTPERAVLRYTRCPVWEGYEEFEVDPEVRVGDDAHQAMWHEALKAVNPKLTHRIIKALEKGDTYCEAVIEFKEE